MTTPGGQLTPGDDTTPPVYGVPDGAYVGDASSPNAISQLSHMTEASAKEAMQTPIGPSFIGQRDGFWGALNTLMGLVQGGIDLVVGVVDAVVDGIKSIINSVGSLFGATRRDMSAVDNARAAGERAIVGAMSSSLEHLDEVQRFGGAYMDYPKFSVNNGELLPHIVPLTHAVPLAAGTTLIPAAAPLTHSTDYTYPDSNDSYRGFARGSAQLELLESGLWMISFQASLLQGGLYPNRPANLWCHVTPADSPYLPVGPPEVDSFGNSYPGRQMTYHRDTGDYYAGYTENFLASYGRAASYVRTQDTDTGGGVSVSGVMFAYLEEGSWKVNLSCTAFTHFGGFASTYILATKVNSETLRQNIDQLKDDIAGSLPGENVPLDLDEDQIAAMVGQASEIEVPEVEVPNE